VAKGFYRTQSEIIINYNKTCLSRVPAAHRKQL
jgi:hypothetical protein